MCSDNRRAEEMPAYSFFQHRQCEYFPCHKGIPEDEFNCLFCYCPLYALGKACEGDCTYNSVGNKDCSECLIPHRRENFDKIISRYDDIMALARKCDDCK